MLKTRRRRALLYVLLGLLGVCLILFALVYSFLTNSDAPAPPPPKTTLLPTFSPPEEGFLIQTAVADLGTVAQLPDPDGYDWVEVASGFDKPLGLTHAGDGSGRIFVVEQAGVVRVIEDGGTALPFLDIRDRVGDKSNEQGLLGLVFHLQYPQNGYFYVNYTDTSGDTVIARYRVSADANIADPGTEMRLLQVNQPFANHNGGGLAFGPDGYLYIGLGDGGAAADPSENAQNTNVFLGKLLRLDVDGGSPYTIPPDNPFVGGGGLPEVWAYGLRNPWRFSFDTLTNDLYIADVGQQEWEEIDFLPAGSPGGVNFGWDIYEGTHLFLGAAKCGGWCAASPGNGRTRCSLIWMS
jgi:glucose/arabinose dehydrogenase